MGTWGAGLYSGDFAMDLRTTIGAVARLPFDSGKLVEILCESEPVAANNPDDEEHTAFWLVLADQFTKRAIVSDRVREQALRIIDAGSDIATMSKLGMKPQDLAKRQRMLAELRARLNARSEVAKQRPVLRKPQPFVMEPGEVFVYPTSHGKCINSYFKSKEKIPNWKHDGWGAAIVAECGRAFDFLAWYRLLTISYARADKPSLEQLHSEPLWELKRPGTCSRVHFERLELEKIGAVSIARDRLARTFPTMPSG